MAPRGTYKPGVKPSWRAGSRLAWDQRGKGREKQKVSLPPEVTIHLMAMLARGRWRKPTGDVLCGAPKHTVVASTAIVSDATCQECLVFLDEALEAGLLQADGTGVIEV
jgi:hypothetical protein